MVIEIISTFTSGCPSSVAVTVASPLFWIPIQIQQALRAVAVFTDWSLL